MQTGVADLVRIVAQAGYGQQRDPVVGRVVRQLRAPLERAISYELRVNGRLVRMLSAQRSLQRFLTTVKRSVSPEIVYL